jgi:hypothetical protein
MDKKTEKPEEYQRHVSQRHSFWAKSGGQAKGFRPEFGANTK